MNSANRLHARVTVNPVPQTPKMKIIKTIMGNIILIRSNITSYKMANLARLRVIGGCNFVVGDIRHNYTFQFEPSFYDSLKIPLWSNPPHYTPTAMLHLSIALYDMIYMHSS